MPNTEAFKTLKENGDPLLSNIAKSYTKGFSQSTQLKHANSLIDLTNVYITSVKDLAEGQGGEQVKSEWGDIYKNLEVAFGRLGLPFDVPRDFPGLPLQKLGSSVQERMTTVPDLMRLADSILPKSFDGEPGKLQSFLDALGLLQTLATTPELVGVAVIFVRTRLVGKARDLIRDENSLTQIGQTLRENIKTQSSQQVIAKLAALKQTASAMEYVAEVEKLSDTLRRSYLSEGVPPATADLFVAQKVTEVLVKSSRSTRVRTVMEAGTFETAHDATTKFIATVSSEAPASQINYFRGRGRGNRGGRGGQGRHWGSNNNNNNNNHGGRGGQNRNWNNNNQGGRGGQNRHNNNNNRNNRSIRAYDSEQGNVGAPHGQASVRDLQNE